MNDREKIDEIRNRLKQMAGEIQKLEELVAKLKEEIEQKCEPKNKDE